jgi:hypothetical protein
VVRKSITTAPHELIGTVGEGKANGGITVVFESIELPGPRIRPRFLAI